MSLERTLTARCDYVEPRLTIRCKRTLEMDTETTQPYRDLTEAGWTNAIVGDEIETYCPVHSKWLRNVARSATVIPMTTTPKTRTVEGYRNDASYQFDVTASNDQALYHAIVAYGADCLRRVPGMSDQTLGVNIKLAVGGWIHDAEQGLPYPYRNYGWGPDHAYVPTATLLLLRDAVGDMRLVSEEDAAESFRPAIEEYRREQAAKR